MHLDSHTDSEQSDAVALAVANKFMEAIFVIFDSLELSFVSVNSDPATSEMEALSLSVSTLASAGDSSLLKPVRARDFEIFHQVQS